MATGHLREGAWFNGRTGEWAFIGEHADWAKRPGNLASIGLLAWISIRVREPYRQQGGQCPLYGEIMGCRLVQAPGVSVRPDIEGWYVETRQEDFAPAEGSIQFRNKMFEVRRGGTWKIGVAREEPK
jgi:hypothetical protein